MSADNASMQLRFRSSSKNFVICLSRTTSSRLPEQSAALKPILQINTSTHLKALAEIYTIYTFAQISDLKIPIKYNCQFFPKRFFGLYELFRCECVGCEGDLRPMGKPGHSGAHVCRLAPPATTRCCAIPFPIGKSINGKFY